MFTIIWITILILRNCTVLLSVYLHFEFRLKDTKTRLLLRVLGWKVLETLPCSHAVDDLSFLYWWTIEARVRKGVLPGRDPSGMLVKGVEYSPGGEDVFSKENYWECLLTNIRNSDSRYSGGEKQRSNITD